MSQRYSTAGMILAYAVETTAGVRPTSGFIKIPEIKSMPSFNPAPEQIESTTLEETEYKTYVEGLKDLGGAREFGANLTADLITAWEACNAAHDALTGGKEMWFAVIHPKLTMCVMFKGDPSPLGLNEASVSAMAETTLYVTPTGAPGWYAKPTVSDSGNVNLGTLMVSTNLLTPFFTPAVTEYSAATTNASDVIVAAPEDESATVTITSSDATISTNTATWASGPNVVNIAVANGGVSKTYKVTVTKS